MGNIYAVSDLHVLLAAVDEGIEIGAWHYHTENVTTPRSSDLPYESLQIEPTPYNMQDIVRIHSLHHCNEIRQIVGADSMSSHFQNCTQGNDQAHILLPPIPPPVPSHEHSFEQEHQEDQRSCWSDEENDDEEVERDAAYDVASDAVRSARQL